jgi:hypothetical protein
VVGDGTEASSACPQMSAPAGGRGGVARGDPTGGPWRGVGQNRRRRLVAGIEEAFGGLGKSREG